MTIFIYEHLTSGALAEQAFSPGLMHEGDAMLQAISTDLLALGNDVCLMRDARLPALENQSEHLSVILVSTQAEYDLAWQQSLRNYQHFLIIAPETDGTLQRLVTTLEQNNKCHYGSSSDAVAICSDKLLCCCRLQQHEILTPDTQVADDWLTQGTSHTEQEWIIKPIAGAGCEQTFRMKTPQVQAYLLSLPDETLRQTIVQPFIQGESLSLSLFINDTELRLLSVNRQHITESDQQLNLQHCEPGCDELVSNEQAMRLARQIHATIPGLWGFVGIDLVKSADFFWVIEINPRLTSSYAEPAFRQQANPALALHLSLQA